ncbi:transcriptional regulator [Halopseudomonas yangmingensis]|uniref:Nitrogen regulatory protein P-II family n=1 Tax=Halopseudomonas yangmingensis TaxID=1720063 RepID=A0A1I4P8D3_9GAMM|nr:transcriptional regulator [Halopseudomonas yangmingensis]SFM24032.1 hypothetical protein SAMN05216217_102176 [Halopseudomonas yangmingensis]
MKFAALVAMLAEDLEEQAIASAKAAGAGGVTILNGRGLGNEQKKTFFGLTFEGGQTVMIFVLEKKLSLKVMKRLVDDLDLKNHSSGVVFTLPLEHIAGIDHQQIEQFEQLIKNDL